MLLAATIVVLGRETMAANSCRHQAKESSDVAFTKCMTNTMYADGEAAYAYVPGMPTSESISAAVGELDMPDSVKAVWRNRLNDMSSLYHRLIASGEKPSDAAKTVAATFEGEEGWYLISTAWWADQIAKFDPRATVPAPAPTTPQGEAAKEDGAEAIEVLKTGLIAEEAAAAAAAGGEPMDTVAAEVPLTDAEVEAAASAKAKAELEAAQSQNGDEE
jgi:hypothetical protein